MDDLFLIRFIFPGCHIEYATNYHGNDILNKRVDTLQACANLCSSTSRGRFWTWNKDGDKNCLVKTSDSGRVHHATHAVSGNKECGESQFKNIIRDEGSIAPPVKVHLNH